MSDPKHLLDALEPGFERSLLEAAQQPSAPQAARERALTHALGAVGAPALAARGAPHAGGQGAVHAGARAASSAGHTATIGSGAIGAGVIKAFAVGLLSGAVVAGGAVGVDHWARQDARPAPHPVAQAPSEHHAEPAVRPRPVPTSGRSASQSKPVASPERRMPPPPARSSTSATRLAEEVAALDRARSALSAGEPHAALSALDDYAARFPRGALLPQATVLRVDALARAGDRAGAAELARTFLSQHPRGPLAERVRRYLEPQ